MSEPAREPGTASNEICTFLILNISSLQLIPVNVIAYGEGIYVGYRWYEKRKMQVLYPFGHGLSYTCFEVGQPVFSATEIKPKTEITVSVPVTNIGKCKGS